LPEHETAQPTFIAILVTTVFDVEAWWEASWIAGRVFSRRNGGEIAILGGAPKCAGDTRRERDA